MHGFVRRAISRTRCTVRPGAAHVLHPGVVFRANGLPPFSGCAARWISSCGLGVAAAFCSRSGAIARSRSLSCILSYTGLIPVPMAFPYLVFTARGIAVFFASTGFGSYFTHPSRCCMLQCPFSSRWWWVTPSTTSQCGTACLHAQVTLVG